MGEYSVINSHMSRLSGIFCILNHAKNIPINKVKRAKGFFGIFLWQWIIKSQTFLWIFLLPCGYNTKLRRFGGIFTKSLGFLTLLIRIFS